MKRGLDMEKILIVANPMSGSKFSMKTAERLIDIFHENNLKAYLYETTGVDDFRQLTLESLGAGYDTFAILGGDGTISEFVSQISDLDERPKILLIPSGTANNFARALKTEINLERLLSKIKQNELTEKQADVGQVNDGYFISTLSAGSLPEISWKTDDDLKESLGSFGYVLEGLSVLNEDKSFDLTVQTPIEELIVTDVSLLVIGLSNSVFGVSTFFEEGEVDDGKLQLYALKASSLMEEAKSLTQQIIPGNQEGYNSKDSLSFTTFFKKATLKASSEIHLAKDGEKGPEFPIELNVLHKHLTFIVAESDK